jgi:BirA family biotin operon repressor/biotin-[acetyl-CoA-carboxylase] ligase
VRSPLAERELLVIESTPSTQAEAIRALQNPEQAPGAILAFDQTEGKGRFERQWMSARGDSLTVSMLFWDYADHPKPWLIGMAVALAAARATGTHVRWPNDVVYQEKKLGGVLVEIVTDPAGRRIPIVGLGLNLNQSEFPEELAEIATSSFLIDGVRCEPDQVFQAVVAHLVELPKPTSWQALETIWSELDQSATKVYRTPEGDLGLAIGYGANGELLINVGGEVRTVLAADAWLGEMAR